MNIIYMAYNNYYNRIVKKEATISAYYTASGTYNVELYDVNFNPNDGITTEHVMTWTNLDWTPDYAVVYDDQAQQGTDPIKSRWFVIEWVRTRTGQYKATLYRDVIADNFNNITLSPMFIEKATVPYESDVAIYNKEILETNQIKTREFKIKDKSKSAWLVGYFAKNINWGTSSGELNPTINIQEVKYPGAITVNTMSAWSWNDYQTTDYKKANAVDVKLHFSIFPNIEAVNGEGIVNTNGEVEVISNGTSHRNANVLNIGLGHDHRVQWVTNNIKPDWITNAVAIRNAVMTEDDYQIADITALNGQTLYVESGVDAGYYDIEVISKGDFSDNSFYATNSAIEQQLCGYITSSDFNYPQDSLNDKPCIQKRIDYSAYRIKLTKKSSIGTTLVWPGTARTLQDAPYGMFCLPASPIYVVKNGLTQFSTLDEYSELNIMCTIAERLDAFCYDIQKLPFCPITSAVEAAPYDGAIDITALIEGQDYAYIKDSSSNNKSIILFAAESSGTFNLSRIYEKITNSQGIEVEQGYDIDKAITIPNNIIDEHDCSAVENYKIANQCDLYRMYTPNWSASFDFNVVKTGIFHTLNVDFTYKPYNPYIHINPDWKKLYGKDYDDYRGLIAQGDFSIPRINDAWRNYQINNKNYLNAFNREVDNLEITQNVERKMQRFNAITGTITGGAAGAATGAKFGGGYGAIAGAAVGTLASGIGGALDIKYGEMLRNEALNYKLDQFNYSLQNIQARPDTIAKVSTYDKNNAIFPVIEYYTATYQEKEALYNKMKYNGMTIMRIGTINDFITEERQYIKGKLIRNEIINDDYHILSAIAEELDKGVFM